MRLLLFLCCFTAALSAQTAAVLSWTVADGLPADDVTALAQDPTGFLWVGTNGGGLARFDGSGFVNYTTTEGLADNFVVALRAEKNGAIYVLTRTGTALLAPGSDAFVSTDPVFTAEETEAALDESLPEQAIRPYFDPSQLPGTRVRALLIDQREQLWVGTDAGLVRLLPATGLQRFTTANSALAANSVSALHPTERGVWLGLGRAGFMRYDDSTGFSRLAVDDPTRGSRITAITTDGGGRTYLATDGRGITVVNDSLGVERLSARSGLPDDRLLTVLPADSGRVWAVSFDQGIGRIGWQDSAFTVRAFGADEGVPLTNFTAATNLTANTLLLGDRLGNLYAWSADSVSVFGRANGLPAAPITALALRRGTQLWVAVAGHGLFYTDLRMPTVRFAAPPARLDALPVNITALLAPANTSEIWLGTNRDLVRVYLDLAGQPDWSRVYGRAEGFVPAKTLAAATTPNGRSWFATTAGLVGLTPDNADGYRSPPTTKLQRVSLFYAPLRAEDFPASPTEGVLLPADQNHLNFSFRAVDLSYPERLRYQWRLRGVDRGWSPMSTETAVRYAGLPPGRFTFLARASIDGGKTWGEAAAFSFRIASPWWRQPLFLLVATLVACGLLVGGFYTIYRRLQRSEAQKRRALETQNQLLTLEQKALQLQMNPHFIFNALNGIRGLADGQHDKEVRQQLARFARLMRGILNNSRRERISLSEEIATLTDYLEMERFCQPFPFTYAITPPEGIDPEEISLPSMLLQPFLENAILHGLPGSQRPGHVSVTFFLRGRRMQCIVEDNGVGRAASATRNAHRATTHRSVALDVTRARLQNLKGRLEIIDLTDATGQATGTRVEMIVPVDSW